MVFEIVQNRRGRRDGAIGRGEPAAT